MAGLVGINYGEALYELAIEEHSLAPMKEALLNVQQVIDENPELKRVMDHPKIDKEEKKKLIEKVFQTDHLLMNFLMLLVDRNRFDALSDIIAVYIQKANAALNIEVATVRSAVELSQQQKEQLRQMLMKKTGCTIELNCVVDPSCLAGIRVQILDEVLDNTIESKLENIKERVAQATLAS